MGHHLTRGDLKFLAAVERDPVRQIDAITVLADELMDAAEARGIEPDLTALDALDADETLADPDQLDLIRGDLRSQLGAIGRGEYASEETTDE